MRNDLLQKLEEIIDHSIRQFLTEGNRLVRNQLEFKNNCSCALGSVAFNYKIHPLKVEDQLSFLLGCIFTSDDFWSFVNGFDGINFGRTLLGRDRELSNLGLKFRNKYNVA